MSIRIDEGVDLGDLSAAWAWEEATGRGVRVAVIDSGIEADHEDLGGCVDVAGGVEIVGEDGDAKIVTGPHEDVFGHGTACAGIIHSIAPEATITSVRVLGPRLGSTSIQFLRALEWTVDQGFDVVNLSLGTKKREWALDFHEVCDRAYFEGIMLVTAANNIMQPSYPSVYASVTSVACNLAKDAQRYHYNPDPPTEFLARGIDVDVAWRGGGRSSGTGNSYAAPHISGIVALIRSKHPDLLPFQVKSVLYALAANVKRGGQIDRPEIAGRVTRAATGIASYRRSQILAVPGAGGPTDRSRA